MDLGPTADGELLQRALDGEPVVRARHPRARRRAPCRPVGRPGGPRPARRVRLRPAGPAARRRRGRRSRPWSEPLPARRRRHARNGRHRVGAAGRGQAPQVDRRRGRQHPRHRWRTRIRVPLGGARRRALRRQAAPRPRRGPARRLALRRGPDLPRPGTGAHRRGARPVDGGNPSTHDLDTAYDAATDATGRAQTILTEVYRTEQRTEALTELSDFYTRAIPQVDAMRPRVPAGSLPAWQRLRDLLGAGEVATLAGAGGVRRVRRARHARRGRPWPRLTGTAPARQPGGGTVRRGRAAVREPGTVTAPRPPVAPRRAGGFGAGTRRPAAAWRRGHRRGHAARRHGQPPGRRARQLDGGRRRWRGHPARRDGEPAGRRCHVLDHRDRRWRGHPARRDDPAAVGDARRPHAADHRPAHQDPARPRTADPAPVEGARRQRQRKTDLRCMSRL